MKTKIQFVRDAWEPRGPVGEVEYEHIPGSPSIENLLEQAWAQFNRGSGCEVEFAGPSASVGDLFVATVEGCEPEQWRVASFGFKRVAV
jgi:hypothetical protein